MVSNYSIVAVARGKERNLLSKKVEAWNYTVTCGKFSHL